MDFTLPPRTFCEVLFLIPVNDGFPSSKAKILVSPQAPLSAAGLVRSMPFPSFPLAPHLSGLSALLRIPGGPALTAQAGAPALALPLTTDLGPGSSSLLLGPYPPLGASAM